MKMGFTANGGAWRFAFLTFVLMAALIGCAGHATEETLSLENVEVGSIVGMPSKPSQNSLVFQAVEDTTDEMGETAPTCMVEYDDVTANGLFGTQICKVRQADYLMGVVAVYLTSCQDENGTEVTCEPSTTTSISERYAIYDGDQVDVQVDQDEALFAGELESFSEAAGFRIGGLQIVTSYVGHVFPDEETAPVAAQRIVHYLRGKAYRICTTPETQIDADTMAVRCGNPEAKLGDLLIDLDSDGTFGFLDPNLITPEAAIESATRPEDYAKYIADNMIELLTGAAESGDLWATDGEYYPVAGYLAQVLPMTGIYELSQANENSVLQAKFFVEGSLIFVDGARARSKHKPICVKAVSPGGCKRDSDPASVGVYNPFYDLFPLSRMPDYEVNVVD